MKKTILADIVVYFFILLFLYTGIAKLMEIHLFREQLVSSPLLGALSGIIAWALPIGEILLAIGLFIPRFQLKALYASLALMLIFTIYVVIILFIDDHLSCSCGGIIEDLSPKEHVLFNSACVILCLVAIMVIRRQRPSRSFRWMTGTSALGLFLMVGWILFSAFSAPPTVKTGLEGRLLPSFTLQMLDSTTKVNTDNIPTGKPLIVIGFSPWCTHCQAETQDIINHYNLFKNFNIYYISSFPLSEMKTFYKYFELGKYQNISMGRDEKNAFLTYFKAPGVPYIAVFDSKKRLKKAIDNQVKAEKLALLAAE